VYTYKNKLNTCNTTVRLRWWWRRQQQQWWWWWWWWWCSEGGCVSVIYLQTYIYNVENTLNIWPYIANNKIELAVHN